MIHHPPSPELTDSSDGVMETNRGARYTKSGPNRMVPKGPIYAIMDLDPLDLLVARKRGPAKATDVSGKKKVRKMVNYRWTANTRTALRHEAQRLGVSVSALAEVIVVMTLKDDEARRILEDMVKLGH
jgi:hypothetical protein